MHNLKWASQVDSVILKLSKSKIHFQLCQLSLNEACKRMLYYAYFYSRLTYCIGIWGPMISQKQLQKLNVIQKDLLRTWANMPKNSHTDPLYRRLKILKVIDVIKLDCLKYAYKVNNNLLCKCISDSLDRPIGIRNTRNVNQPNIPIHRKKVMHNSLYCTSLREWFKLPYAVRNKPSLQCFVRNCKQDLISKY